MRQGWLLAVVLVMTGCVQSASVVCGDGTVCPEGATCDVALGRCITEAQTQACATLAEGDPCSIVGAPGECRRGACEPLVCGDGRATGAEACDGDDLAGASCASLGFSGETTGVRCNELCRLETTGCTGICGDGVRDGSELCDGANPAGVTCARVGFYREVTPGPLTCNGLCGWTTSGCADYCGDGITNGPELCDGAPPVETCVDLGFDAGRSACSAICGAGFDTCARFGFRPTFVADVFATGFHASSLTAQWIVGTEGFTARLGDAGAWEPIPVPVTTDVTDVWSVSPTRAWAVARAATTGGEPSLLRFEADAWELITGAPALTVAAVWGLDDRALLATSDGVHVWSAAGWQRLGTLAGAVTALAGTSATDVYAATATGLFHWDGTAWTLAITARVFSLDVRGPDEVYGLGRPGDLSTPLTLFSWDGSAWSGRAVPPLTSASALAVTATAPNDVWIRLSGARMLHFDGQRWIGVSRVNPGSFAVVTGLVALGIDEVVGATTDGFAMRFRGQVMSRPPEIAGSTIKDVWTDGEGAMFAVNQAGEVLADRASALSITSVSSNSLAAVWGTGPSDVWAGGAVATLVHYDGDTWTPVAFGAVTADVRDIVGHAAADLWVVTSSNAYHFDGAAWTAVSGPPGLSMSIAATGSGEFWVSTLTNELYRWDGTGFVLMHTSPATIKALSIQSPADIYVATSIGLEHYDGSAWTMVPGPAEAVIDVAGSAPDDMFAVSSTGLRHFDGTGWLPVSVGDTSGGEIRFVRARPHLAELILPGFVTMYRRSLLRTRPWNCRATETACADGVDDDCDGVLDVLDSDCP